MKIAFNLALKSVCLLHFIWMTACVGEKEQIKSEPAGDNFSPEIQVHYPPVNHYTYEDHLLVRGSTRSSKIKELSIGGVKAHSEDGFKTWKARVPLAYGDNLFFISATSKAGVVNTDLTSLSSRALFWQGNEYSVTSDNKNNRTLVLNAAEKHLHIIDNESNLFEKISLQHLSGFRSLSTSLKTTYDENRQDFYILDIPSQTISKINLKTPKFEQIYKLDLSKLIFGDSGIARRGELFEITFDSIENNLVALIYSYHDIDLKKASILSFEQDSLIPETIDLKFPHVEDEGLIDIKGLLFDNQQNRFILIQNGPIPRLLSMDHQSFALSIIPLKQNFSFGPQAALNSENQYLVINDSRGQLMGINLVTGESEPVTEELSQRIYPEISEIAYDKNRDSYLFFGFIESNLPNRNLLSLKINSSVNALYKIITYKPACNQKRITDLKLNKKNTKLLYNAAQDGICEIDLTSNDHKRLIDTRAIEEQLRTEIEEFQYQEREKRLYLTSGFSVNSHIHTYDIEKQELTSLVEEFNRTASKIKAFKYDPTWQRLIYSYKGQYTEYNIDTQEKFTPLSEIEKKFRVIDIAHGEKRLETVLLGVPYGQKQQSLALIRAGAIVVLHEKINQDTVFEQNLPIFKNISSEEPLKDLFATVEVKSTGQSKYYIAQIALEDLSINWMPFDKPIAENSNDYNTDNLVYSKTLDTIFIAKDSIIAIDAQSGHRVYLQ